MKRLGYFVIFAAACGTQESGSLLTNGMSAEMSASSDGAKTTVTAELFAGDPGQLIFVKLTDNDALVATSGVIEQRMSEAQFATIVGYSTTFLGDGGDQMFNVDFRRTVDDGAPASEATVPSAFAIDPPAPSMSRAQAMMFTFGPAGADAMTFEIDGSCIQTFSGSLPSNSVGLTVTANTVQKLQGQNIPDSCDATLTLKRTRDGALDPAFGKGGKIFGEQVRKVTFTSTL